MKKILSSLLAMCMMLLLFTVVSAENVWTKASDWAISDLSDANSLGLFPACLKNADLTQKITRAEQAALSVKIYEVSTGKTATSAENPFSDTNDAEVLKALNLGVTSGTSATTFEPDASLTREQAATMLSRIYKKINIDGWTLEKDNEFKFEFNMPNSFKDHSKISSWAEQSVYFMASKQWILGNELKEFIPLDNCSREQALIIAKRMATFFKSQKPAEPEKEEFKIAFVGGSITQNGTRWIGKTRDYLQKKLPDKKVVTINLGITGTAPNYGAMRMHDQILATNPDLIVIDFSVNRYSNYISHLESMLRECINADKVPGVMFVHATRPIDFDHDEYELYTNTIKTTDKLASHYNLETVNVYEYMQDLYYSSGSEDTFLKWLGNYYSMGDSEYNSVPKFSGYELYADAMIDAFEKKGLEPFIKPIAAMPVFFTQHENNHATAKYRMIYMSDDRLEFSDNWNHITQQNPDTSKRFAVTTNQLSFPNFTEGIRSTMLAGEKITFKTSASSLYIMFISSTFGNKAKVLVNGTEVGELSCVFGPYEEEIAITQNKLQLSGSGTKTVTFVTAEEDKPFRLCAIVEEFMD